jgi:ATP:ADP antiporter, AAA family
MQKHYFTFLTPIRQALTQRQFILSMSLIFIVIGMVMVITSYMPSLFLGTYPATYLPYLYVAQAVMLTIVTVLTNHVSAKYPRQFTLGCQIAFALLVLLLEPLLHRFFWLPFFYCAFLNLISVFSVINVWNLVAQAFDVRTFKANSVTLTSSGTIAGVVFGYMLPILVSLYNIKILPVILVLFIVLAIYPTLKIHLLPAPLMPQKKVDFNIHQYPLAKNMFFYIFLVIVITTLVDYVFKSSLATYYHGDKDKIASFIGIFIASSNLLTLFVQFFLTKRLMTHLSVVGLLLILPLMLFLSAGYLSIEYTLISATIISVLSNTLTYSIYNIATESVLNILPVAIKLRAKSLVKGISRTAGTLFAAFLLWLLNLYFPGRVIALTICFFGLWAIFFAWKLKKDYRETLQDGLVLKRFNEDSLVEQTQSDNELRKIVLGALQHRDLGINLLGLSLFSRVKFNVLPQELLYLLDNDNRALRLSAINASEYIDDPHLNEVLIQRVSLSQDPEEIYALLKVIYLKSPDMAYALAMKFQEDIHPRIRAIVIYIEMMCGDLEGVSHAVNAIRQMVYSPDKEERVHVANILADLQVGNLQKEFALLIQDESSIVSIHAIYAASKQHPLGLLPLVVGQLNRVKVAYHAVKALALWGDESISLLQRKIIEDQDINGRIGAVKALAQLNSQQSDEAFSEILVTRDYLILHQICKYLARRSKTKPPSHVLKKQIEKILEQDVELIFSMKALLRLNQKLSASQRCELSLRIRLLSKTFLYQLAILHDPNVFLKLIPILENGMDTDNHQSISSTLELIETTLTHKRYKEYLAKVYEDQMLDEFLLEYDDASFCIQNHDPTFMHFLNALEQADITKGVSMDNVEKLMLLRQTALFKKLPAESLLAIAEVTKCREMIAGEVIYQQDGYPDALYIIGKGSVALSREDKVLVELKEGQFFGFIGVLDNEPWYTTATSQADGLLLYIDKPAFDRILEDIPDVLMAMTHVLLTYLKKILQSNRLQ